MEEEEEGGALSYGGAGLAIRCMDVQRERGGLWDQTV